MNELWRDYSAHQDNPDTVRLISPQVAIDNGVVGFIFRSGTSWTYKDPTFNYLYPLVEGSYRTSYHNFSPGADPDNQIDNWLEQHPAMDVLPRFAAVEGNYNDLEPYQIAATFYDFSETYKARVGQRCGIYTRKQLADLWLTPYLDEDWLNEHWWWIAQYDARRDTEQLDRVIIPPNGVLLERCWLKQTADQMVGFPGEAESGYVDRDRFQFENMDEWISTNFGGDITNPDPPIDDCKGLWDWFEIESNFLRKRLDTLQQGQLELAENGLGYEERLGEHFNGLDLCKGALIELDDKLDVLLDNKENLHDKYYELAKEIEQQRNTYNDFLFDYNEDWYKLDKRIKELPTATHSHLEPVGGTFWQRLRWLFTGRTSG